MCREACNFKAENVAAVANGGEPKEFKRPKHAKCTGMGSALKVESCQAGYFDAVDQTLAALGIVKKQEKKRLFLGLKESKVKVKENEVEVEKEMEKEEVKEMTVHKEAEEDEKIEEEGARGPQPRTEAELRAEENKAELMRLADKQVRQNQDVDTYLELSCGRATSGSRPATFCAPTPSASCTGWTASATPSAGRARMCRPRRSPRPSSATLARAPRSTMPMCMA